MPEEIKAHITGIVFQVTAKPGDRLQAGDPVIVLESMKMEIPVEMPRAGAVKEIRVQEGQTVQAVQLSDVEGYVRAPLCGRLHLAVALAGRADGSPHG